MDCFGMKNFVTAIIVSWSDTALVNAPVLNSVGLPDLCTDPDHISSVAFNIKEIIM
jgi:hypothetical protein